MNSRRHRAPSLIADPGKQRLGGVRWRDRGGTWRELRHHPRGSVHTAVWARGTLHSSTWERSLGGDLGQSHAGDRGPPPSLSDCPGCRDGHRSPEGLAPRASAAAGWGQSLWNPPEQLPTALVTSQVAVGAASPSPPLSSCAPPPSSPLSSHLLLVSMATPPHPAAWVVQSPHRVKL